MANYQPQGASKIAHDMLLAGGAREDILKTMQEQHHLTRSDAEDLLHLAQYWIDHPEEAEQCHGAAARERYLASLHKGRGTRFRVMGSERTGWDVRDDVTGGVVPGADYYDYQEDAQRVADRLNGAADVDVELRAVADEDERE